MSDWGEIKTDWNDSEENNKNKLKWHTIKKKYIKKQFKSNLKAI